MKGLKTLGLVSLFALGLVLSPAAWAELEIQGLVIDETQTKIGQDFYQSFFALWEPPEEVECIIFIIERASPQWGSWIWVRVNDSVVWRGVLRPRSEEIEEAARRAVEVARKYLSF